MSGWWVLIRRYRKWFARAREPGLAVPDNTDRYPTNDEMADSSETLAGHFYGPCRWEPASGGSSVGRRLSCREGWLCRRAHQEEAVRHCLPRKEVDRYAKWR